MGLRVFFYALYNDGTRERFAPSQMDIFISILKSMGEKSQPLQDAFMTSPARLEAATARSILESLMDLDESRNGVYNYRFDLPDYSRFPPVSHGLGRGVTLVIDGDNCSLTGGLNYCVQHRWRKLENGEVVCEETDIRGQKEVKGDWGRTAKIVRRRVARYLDTKELSKLIEALRRENCVALELSTGNDDE